MLTLFLYSCRYLKTNQLAFYDMPISLALYFGHVGFWGNFASPLFCALSVKFWPSRGLLGMNGMNSVHLLWANLVCFSLRPFRLIWDKFPCIFANFLFFLTFSIQFQPFRLYVGLTRLSGFRIDSLSAYYPLGACRQFPVVFIQCQLGQYFGLFEALKTIKFCRFSRALKLWHFSHKCKTGKDSHKSRVTHAKVKAFIMMTQHSARIHFQSNWNKKYKYVAGIYIL